MSPLGVPPATNAPPLPVSQAHAFADAMRESSRDEITHWAAVADTYQDQLQAAEDQLASTAHELAEVRGRHNPCPPAPCSVHIPGRVCRITPRARNSVANA